MKTFCEFLNESQIKNRLDSMTRRKINNLLPTGYGHKEVPIDDIADVLDKHGLILIQEDNTEFSGIFTGREGSSKIRIAYKNTKDGTGAYAPITNSMLVLNWYKGAKSYDINCYLS